MRGPIGRTVLQYKPYLLKEIEFILKLDKKQASRYLAFNAAVGGPKAFLYMIKSFPLLAVAITAAKMHGAIDWDLDDVEEELNKLKISHGLSGMTGINMVPSMVAQLPQMSGKLQDYLGPTAGDIGNVLKYGAKPLAGGIVDSDNRHKMLQKLVPAYRTVSQGIEASMTDEGISLDDKGKLKFTPKATELHPYFLGGIPIRQSTKQEANYANYKDIGSYRKLVDSLKKDIREASGVKREEIRLELQKAQIKLHQAEIQYRKLRMPEKQ
jgi:hypothetical protein